LTAKKQQPAKIKCPDCELEYNTNKGLSSHRRSVHGYVGTAVSTVWERLRKAKASVIPADPGNPLQCSACDFLAKNTAGLTWHMKTTHAPNPLQCPDCSFAALTTQKLIWHRKQEHGYLGHKGHRPEQILTEVVTAVLDPLQCQLCDFRAQAPGGLTHHMTRKHKGKTTPRIMQPKRREIEPTQTLEISAPASSNNRILHAEESHASANGIPEATLALALGRFQELCRSIAYEHDLPPRMFAARLAGLVYAATVR
jgi:uncharacterized C2H2 Zn-finger protein